MHNLPKRGSAGGSERGLRGPRRAARHEWGGKPPLHPLRARVTLPGAAGGFYAGLKEKAPGEPGPWGSYWVRAGERALRVSLGFWAGRPWLHRQDQVYHRWLVLSHHFPVMVVEALQGRACAFRRDFPGRW